VEGILEKDKMEKEDSQNKAYRLRQALIAIALGQRKADQYIRGGLLLNVYTGERLKVNMALYRDRIAYIGLSEKMIGPKTRLWEAEGKILAPGYMDPHAHTDLYYNPATFSEEVVQTGTTAVFSDMHDLANALGFSGILQVLKEAPSYPLTYYFGVPSSSPPFPRIEGKELFNPGDILRLLKRPEALGLSEVTAFVRLLKGDRRLLQILVKAAQLGKTAEGHTTGVSHDKLNALVGAGLTSCHESITGEDVKKRLRLGLHVMCRGGSIRNDLPELIKAVRQLSVYDSSRIMLTPDGLFPGDMLRSGYMDSVLRQVIQLGLDPVRAYQMVTINPARYFRLDREQGALAPGRRADILMLPDLTDPRPISVISKGRWIRREGRPILPSLDRFPAGTYDRPLPPARFRPEFFSFKTCGRNSFPVITIVDKTLTRRVDRRIREEDGLLQTEPGEDLAKIALIPRQGKQAGLGLVSGFGAGLGAIASSIAHETHSLMVMGFNDRDMALAANRVIKMAGGIVVVKEGKILSRLLLPIGGVMSTHKIPQLAGELEKITSILKELGCPLKDPLWTLGFLSFTSLIDLRITFSGIYEVKTGRILYNGFENPGGPGKKRDV
jgi:adenine deaminase